MIINYEGNKVKIKLPKHIKKGETGRLITFADGCSYDWSIDECIEEGYCNDFKEQIQKQLTT